MSSSKGEPNHWHQVTVVEVALAVAVLLILAGGAVLGYQAVRDHARGHDHQVGATRFELLANTAGSTKTVYARTFYRRDECLHYVDVDGVAGEYCGPYEVFR